MDDRRAKLYVILGSHACRTGMLLLEHKGIPYQRVDLPTGLHPIALRLRAAPQTGTPRRRAGEGSNPRLAGADRLGTVPVLLLNGQLVQTNLRIARFLDDHRPEPPLFPADPDERREVEAAECWGDDAFQMVARRLVMAGATRGRDGIANGGNDGRLGPLLYRSERLRLTVTKWIGRLVFNVDEQTEREMLEELPGMLDRIDAWISAGTLNGEELNAADYMIVTSAALLTYRPDLRHEIESRPVGRLVDRVLPEPAGARAGGPAHTVH